MQGTLAVITPSAVYGCLPHICQTCKTTVISDQYSMPLFIVHKVELIEGTLAVLRIVTTPSASSVAMIDMFHKFQCLLVSVDQ